MALHSLGESLLKRSKKLSFAELFYRMGVVVSSSIPVPVSVQSLRGGMLTLAADSRLQASEVQLRLGAVRERLQKEFPEVVIDHIRVVVRSSTSSG